MKYKILFYILVFSISTMAQTPQFSNPDFENIAGMCSDANTINAVGWKVWDSYDPNQDFTQSALCESCNSSNHAGLLSKLNANNGLVATNPFFEKEKIEYLISFLLTSTWHPAEGTLSIYGVDTDSKSTSTTKVLLSSFYTNPDGLIPILNCKRFETMLPKAVTEYPYILFDMGGLPSTTIDDISVLSCDNDNDIVIDNDITWTSQDEVPFFGNYIDDVVIKNGATLTIGFYVYLDFCNGGDLFIEPGGTLELKGTLKSSGGRWSGVHIKSEPDKPGVFYSSGAIISDAVIGIRTLASWGFYGNGTIDCNSTVFVNNALGVLIGNSNNIGASNINYNATFNLCSFFINDNFSHDIYWGGIDLWNVEGIKVRGCSFLVDAPLKTNNSGNFGISALNSGVSIDDYNINSDLVKISTFTNLGYGVATNYYGSNHEFIVKNSDFENCAVGILNRGISSGEITYNKFDMTSLNPFYYHTIHPSYRMQVGVAAEGIIQELGIEENEFFGPNTSTSILRFGTHINNIGVHNNYIRNNIYDKLNFASSSSQTNGSQALRSGLAYTCNTNTGNAKDFNATHLPILRPIQSYLKPATGEIGPTKNSFSYNGNSWDFINLQSPIGDFGYFYDPNGLNETPMHFTGITPDLDYVVSNPCESHYDRDKRSQSHKLYMQEEIKQNIIDYFENKNLFNTILSKNGAASSTMQTALTKSNEIELSKAREKIDANILIGIKFSRQQNDIQEERAWYKRMDNFDGELLLAGSYFSHGDWNAAVLSLEQAKSNVSLTIEQVNDIDKISNMYSAIGNQRLDKLNDQVVDVLTEISNERYGNAPIIARAILTASGEMYPPEINLSESDISNFNDINTSSDALNTKFITAYPIPSDYLVEFNIDVNCSSNNTKVFIFNPSGNIETILDFNMGELSKSWDSSNSPSGLYRCELVVDNIPKDVVIVTISK